MRGRVLVVEDVGEMAELIGTCLEFEGLKPVLAPSAEAGMEELSKGSFDLVLLDLNLPGMDGFEFLQRLRADSTVPVMIVSARDDEGDVVTALGIGADEYLAKPFSPKALAARARALIRRAQHYPQLASRRVARFGPFELDLDAGSLVREGKRVPLSAREFSVLAYLVSEAGKVHSPDEIFEAVWDRAYGDLTAVGVYIQRLRRKLEEDPAAPRWIVTERGLGYRFVSEGQPTEGQV